MLMGRISEIFQDFPNQGAAAIQMIDRGARSGAFLLQVISIYLHTKSLHTL
jgi:hypothetical protein